MIQDGHLALSSALEKKLNRVPWNPSVCMQQPCTSVWMTLHTKTRLMDLHEELNKRQYSCKRSVQAQKRAGVVIS